MRRTTGDPQLLQNVTVTPVSSGQQWYHRVRAIQTGKPWLA